MHKRSTIAQTLKVPTYKVPIYEFLRNKHFLRESGDKHDVNEMTTGKQGAIISRSEKNTKILLKELGCPVKTERRTCTIWHCRITHIVPLFPQYATYFSESWLVYLAEKSLPEKAKTERWIFSNIFDYT